MGDGATDVDPLIFGLAGFGRWGTRLLDEFSALGVSVACWPGMTDRNRGLADQACDHVVDSYAELLAIPRLAAVVIATPPHTHGSLAMIALEAGHHVFVEKPLAGSRSDAASLTQRAAETGRFLMTDYTLLHHAALAELRGWMLGHTGVQLRSTVTKWGTFGADLVDTLLVHDVALAISMLGAPTHVEVVWTAGEHSHDVLLVRFSHLAGTSVLEADRIDSTRGRRLVVQRGTELFTWDGGTDVRCLSGAERAPRIVATAVRSPLAAACAFFVDQVRDARSIDTAMADFECSVAEACATIRSLTAW